MSELASIGMLHDEVVSTANAELVTLLHFPRLPLRARSTETADQGTEPQRARPCRRIEWLVGAWGLLGSEISLTVIRRGQPANR